MRQRPTKLFAAIFAFLGVALLIGAAFSFYSRLSKNGWLEVIGAIMVFAVSLWFWADIRRRE
ncbi:MAG: hypothetical protein JWM99_4292 [Verrucomicrobiales bacterium]|nr:hypothetical protein [Verrucomicrobiales bacterium]